MRSSCALAQNAPACDGNITIVVQSPHAEAPKHDAAWDAYAKQYNDSSVVKSTYMTCSPKM